MASSGTNRAQRGGAPLAAYVLAVATYIPLGVFAKTWLLNWIVGPLYLVVAVTLLTPLVERAGLGRRRI